MDNDGVQQEWPESWYKVLYSDSVVKISTNGKKLNQKQYLKSGSFPVIDQGQNRVAGYADDIELTINCDFPVIVFGDHTRTVKFVKQPFVAGADGVKVAQPEKFIQPKLLVYFTQYLAISIKDKGYARHYQWVEKEYIGIPPEKEQHRIVTKIEELFSELDKGIESLKTAREQLKVYRQALLKHAFEGKLTEQWREDNADKLESADDLLVRIQQERETRYQQQLEDWKAAVNQWEDKGKEGKKPSKPTAFKLMPEIFKNELAVLPQISLAWKYFRLAEIAKIGSGMSVSKNRKLENPVKVAYLRVANVQRGKLVLDEIKTMNIENEKLDSLKLKKYDILFNEGGDRDKLGRGWIWESQVDSCITQNHVFRASTYLGGEFHSKFVSHWENSFGRDYFERVGKQTTNLASINKTVLSMFPIPMPSLREQEKIIEVIDSCTSTIDTFEKDINEALLKSQSLRQAILKKAFSGQLVPQDPNDEPASVLLDHIKAEKMAQAQTRPTSRKKKKTVSL